MNRYGALDALLPETRIHSAETHDLAAAERIAASDSFPPEPPDFLSADTGSAPAETKSLFRTAREIAADTTVEVEWIAPYVARGALTEVDGKIKSGKSTFIAALCRAVLDGQPFLGQPTSRTGIVYLTEQPTASFREVLRRADLLDRDDFAVLLWRDVSGRRWPDVAALAAEECKRRGAGLMVVDTLGRFAGIRGDGENNAGEADAAMAPLQVAAADGLGVVVLRHERKSGGEVGDSARGSSAFGGAVDTILAIRRGEGNSRPTVRVLHALSRFDGPPETLVVELTDVGYVAKGDESQVAFAEARDGIREALPDTQETALQFAELQLKLPDAKRSTIQDALARLIADGDVARIGGGKKGSPYRYFLSAGVGEQFWQKETEDEPTGWREAIADPPSLFDEPDPLPAFDEVMT